MQFRYGLARQSICTWCKRLTVIAGFTLLPVTIRLEKIWATPSPPVTPGPAAKPDARIVRLRGFFSRLHCPVSNLAEDFVHASDDNRLDWRLLPSIAVIESGGGKEYRNNNIFGWNNGHHQFTSLRSAINEVAFQLGKGRRYQNRDIMGKLKIYNPDEDYAYNVVRLMNRISPVEQLEPVQRLIRFQNEFVYAAD